ncbi:hypothetical protein TNCT_89361 [Trichonephila clavata]|uniref:Uncharacterized protein n=1 Tax=Trichonephila clavata TaxID=2740835 RepID=A0A8X6LPP3_TRICU|nr:hypothetical protein TNCT_89361 [Trichonephila clavata]
MFSPWPTICSLIGVLSSVQGIAVLAFLDKDDPKGKKDYPDYQLYFAEGATGLAKYQLRVKPEYFEAIYGPYKEKTFYWCLSRSCTQEQGRSHFAFLKPLRSPIIDPNTSPTPETWK